MANILIFNTGSMPIPNIPIQYLVSENTLFYLGRNDVLINPILPNGWNFQNSKVLSGSLTLLTPSELNTISGAQQSGIQIAQLQKDANDKLFAKNIFVQSGNLVNARAMYAFNSLVFKAINSLRDYMGLDTYTPSQLISAINNEIDGTPINLNDSGKISNFYPATNPSGFSTLSQVQAGANILNTKINTLSGYAENTFVKI